MYAIRSYYAGVHREGVPGPLRRGLCPRDYRAPGDEEGGDLHVRGLRALPDGVEHGRELSPADFPVELRRNNFV